MKKNFEHLLFKLSSEIGHSVNILLQYDLVMRLPKKKCIFLVFYFTLWRLQTGSWKLFVLKISAGQGVFLALCIFWFTYILFCLRGEHVGNCSVVNKILRQIISKNLIFETFQRKISLIKSLKCKMLFYFTFFFHRLGNILCVSLQTPAIFKQKVWSRCQNGTILHYVWWGLPPCIKWKWKGFLKKQFFLRKLDSHIYGQWNFWIQMCLYLHVDIKLFNDYMNELKYNYSKVSPASLQVCYKIEIYTSLQVWYKIEIYSAKSTVLIL